MSGMDSSTRTAERETRDRSAIRTAIARLARVLTEGKDDVFSVAPSDDPVLVAVEIVARWCGIDMQTVPALLPEMSASDRVLAAAEASSFRVRRVALTGRWWRTDSGPLLCFREYDNHPICALPCGQRRYRLIDPQSGTDRPADETSVGELADRGFTFYRGLPAHKLDWRDLLSFGFFQVGADIRRLLLATLAASLLGLVMPLAIKVLFDTAIPNAEMPQVLQLTLAMLAAAFGAGAFEALRAIAFVRLETKSGGRVEAAVWDRLLRLPAHFFRDYAVGDLTLRAMGVSTMRRIVTGVTLVAFLSGAFGLVNFVLMFVLDFGLALVALAMTVIWALLVWLCARAQVAWLRESFAIQGRVIAQLLQFLHGISKLRSAGAELRAFSAWANGFAEQKKASYHGASIGNWITAFGAGFVVLTSAIVFAVVAFVYSDIQAGTFVAFIVAFGQFAAAAIAAIQVFSNSLVVMPLYERLKPILEAEPEIDRSKAHPGDLAGAVSVNNVTFRYDPDGPPVLDDVSIHAARGEFIALVGPSGSGKSTLLRLLLGFEEPEAGTVAYDDKDLAHTDILALRRQLGVVLQNSGLLPGDILSNIVGSTNLSQEDAWEAAHMAGIADDIAAMPMAMQTIISEDAGTISGGQKQRLIIARALVRRPRILLLDEATSALDNKTQKAISESLDRLAATRIVIAHRLSTIRHADRIYVVVGGRVVQSGSYTELMGEEGPFKKLAERQLA